MAFKLNRDPNLAFENSCHLLAFKTVRFLGLPRKSQIFLPFPNSSHQSLPGAQFVLEEGPRVIHLGFILSLLPWYLITELLGPLLNKPALYTTPCVPKNPKALCKQTDYTERFLYPPLGIEHTATLHCSLGQEVKMAVVAH